MSLKILQPSKEYSSVAVNKYYIVHLIKSATCMINKVQYKGRDHYLSLAKSQAMHSTLLPGYN